MRTAKAKTPQPRIKKKYYLLRKYPGLVESYSTSEGPKQFHTREEAKAYRRRHGRHQDQIVYIEIREGEFPLPKVEKKEEATA